MSKQCTAVSQLGQRGLKVFTIQAIILRFIRNYQLLNKKPSNNHQVGGEGDQIGLWKQSTAGYSDIPRDIIISAVIESPCLFISFLFFLLPLAPEQMHRLFCFANSESINTHLHVPESVSARVRGEKIICFINTAENLQMIVVMQVVR